MTPETPTPKDSAPKEKPSSAKPKPKRDTKKRAPYKSPMVPRMRFHQYHFVLAISAALLVASLVQSSEPAWDVLTLIWVPLLCGAVLSFITLLFSRNGARWQLTQGLLFFSVDLVFLVGILYLVHTLGGRVDPLQTLAPWDYSLALATIALPIIAVDLRHEIPQRTLLFRLVLALLVPLGILPIALVITPATTAVAAALSLATFLLLVDALLKVASHEAPEGASVAPVDPSINPVVEWLAQPKKGEKDSVNAHAIFAAREERFQQHQDLHLRARAANPPLPPRDSSIVLPAEPTPVWTAESPTPASYGASAKTSGTPADSGPVYFSSESTEQGRASTGIERLDNLLRGGIPLQSHAAIIGPIFIGKEVVVQTFIAAGLAQGEQVLVIASSRGPAELARELGAYLPNIDTFQKKGTIQWVDAYAGDVSRTVSIPYLVTVSGPGDFDGILEGVSKIASSFRGKRFRAAFISLSTCLTQAEERKAFDFLRAIQSTLRNASATTLYVVDKGVMEERELEEIQTMMDGGILFKRENDRNFLSVAGLGEIATHQWIEYQRTGRTLTLGSFALERIR